MIGDRLRLLRKGKGLSQVDLADKLDTSQGYISDVEKGLKKPGTDFLLSLKRFFSVDLNWFLTGEGEAQQRPPTFTHEEVTSYQAPQQEDPQIREMIEIMRDLDKQARSDLLRQAKKELELKVLKLNNLVKSEVIDALEPAIVEQQRKLRRKEEPVAENQETTGSKISSSTELNREHSR
jgi:transcriptional regulator with XRE-family HTH domain